MVFLNTCTCANNAHFRKSGHIYVFLLQNQGNKVCTMTICTVCGKILERQNFGKYVG